MSNTDLSLFESHVLPELPNAMRTVILPSQVIKQMVDRKWISAHEPIDDSQVQPASLDLRLGPLAYQVQASFLPGARATVAERLAMYTIQDIDVSRGAFLQKGCVYIIQILESLCLPNRISGVANPKSSIGRLNVFTRLITDYGVEFDQIRNGYNGPLYLEIAPLAFSIYVRVGSTLNQIRFRHETPNYTASVQSEPQSESITLDVLGHETGGLIGYKAKKHTAPIDVDRRYFYDPNDYWDPVYAGRRVGLILDPEEFYILASRETVAIPPDCAAEMVAYDPLVGEFRVHYAGFFDPAFGHDAGNSGGVTRAVLEVRSHDVPFIIQDGQVVGRLVHERLAASPDKLYGTQIGSAYQRQGLALSKHFRAP